MNSIGQIPFQIDLSIVFLIAVILIWFMIAYQLILTIAGFLHHLRALAERKRIDVMSFMYPSVSILIPAHNEEIVIGATLNAMLALDYPRNKIEIIVINDGSTDSTGEIVKSFAQRDSRVIVCDVPRAQAKKGKSRALNLGLKAARYDYIAVYDADNTPEPDALKYLVAQLLLNPELGAATGKFRTVNKNRNLLTRFINIETLTFQSILQAGRCQLFGIVTLPGTNFVIRRRVLEEVGTWDEGAMTEDAELSIRMYIRNWKIKFIQYAVTFEQEPERWDVWLRQRTRWVMGNNYLVRKFFTMRKQIKSKKLQLELFYIFAMYYVFFAAIVMSDILFILGILHVVSIPIPGPYGIVFAVGIVLFLAEIILALSYDREDSFKNLLCTILMYFTYCQFWLVVVAMAFHRDLIRKEAHTWAKTPRFKPCEADLIGNEPVMAPTEPVIGSTGLEAEKTGLIRFKMFLIAWILKLLSFTS